MRDHRDDGDLTAIIGGVILMILLITLIVGALIIYTTT